MQRVRIGITGLAFVFVLVLLGMVFTSPSAEAPITANAIEQELSGNAGAPVPPVNQTQPEEPLAELGVAPGKADVNQSAPAAAQPAAQ
ncbi:MAG TPA: hypothetical protein VGB70_00445 [Allosphingosinicella sp.]|jgi:hypothetical protein